MMSKAYLDIALKFKLASHNSYASMMYLHMLMLDYQDSDATSFLEMGEEGTDDQQSKLALIASYQLLSGINVKTYQTVFHAGELQREFFMNRALQLRVQLSGGQLPPQILQLLYLQNYSTLLKTMKLSYCFQLISHFRTWLEDAIDVHGAIVEKVDNYALVAEEQEDDLIQDKMFAFHSYYMYAMLDFQVYWIDSYLEQMFMAMAGGAPQAAPEGASFLEEQSSTEFAPYMYMSNPHMYMKIVKFYKTMYQLYGAQAALSSVMADHQAYTMENDDDKSNDEQAEQMRTFAKHMFAGGFARNLLMTSQLDQWTATFELYSLYAPFMMGAGAGAPPAPPAPTPEPTPTPSP